MGFILDIDATLPSDDFELPEPIRLELARTSMDLYRKMSLQPLEPGWHWSFSSSIEQKGDGVPGYVVRITAIPKRTICYED